MNRFWEVIIKPLFIHFKPRKIIEIGMAQGQNTAKVLEYCTAMNVQLHVVDPAPQVDVNEWITKYPANLKILLKLSLQALEEEDNYDVVLIDGDHNWYTVYRELKLIETYAQKANTKPLIVLHDTSWPYGRRDMYYLPDTIPAEYRKPNAQKGMIMGLSELADHGGANPMLFNALYEGGERNGVLTAVEDFLKETSLEYSFEMVHSNNGLGVIYPKNTENDLIVRHILQSSNM